MSAANSSSVTSDRKGALVISLDLELFWGMRTVATIERNGIHVRGVRQALPRMIHAFNQHGVKATFAALGMLFSGNKEALLASLPQLKPGYTDKHLSPYNGYLGCVGTDEASDPLHFGASLIHLIQQHPQHEIGCHTFSHYYCLEEGQTKDEFNADLEAAVAVAKKCNIRMESLVFPANQINADYFAVLGRHGIRAYRGNEPNWLNRASSWKQRGKTVRLLRLFDAWLNLTGPNCNAFPPVSAVYPVNIPASHFLRPWNKHAPWLEDLRLKRITKAMDHAARSGTIYHLWWHPHNFGMNLEKNMAFLERILDHFNLLERTHGLRSMTMAEVASEARHSPNAL